MGRSHSVVRRSACRGAEGEAIDRQNPHPGPLRGGEEETGPLPGGERGRGRRGTYFAASPPGALHFGRSRMTGPQNLVELQQWFLSAVTRLYPNDDPGAVNALVAASRQQTADE